MPRLFAGLLGAVLLAGAASAAPAGPSLKIVVYGGTGNIGRRIVHEALTRGHTVKIIVRDPAAATEHDARLTVLQGDVLDGRQVAQQIAGEDVIVCAVSFRKPPDFAAYRRAAEVLVGAQRTLAARAPRLIVVGGAGSLEVAPGVLLVDRLPAAYRGEVTGQKEALDYYRTAPDVPWTYFSPARTIEPGMRTGQFRLGDDQLITDAKGDSRISMEDYAVAVIDEAEKPAHLHRRFTIGY
jgi:putative NADH-flavin reductase